MSKAVIAFMALLTGHITAEVHRRNAKLGISQCALAVAKALLARSEFFNRGTQ